MIIAQTNFSIVCILAQNKSDKRQTHYHRTGYYCWPITTGLVWLAVIKSSTHLCTQSRLKYKVSLPACAACVTSRQWYNSVGPWLAVKRGPQLLVWGCTSQARGAHSPGARGLGLGRMIFWPQNLWRLIQAWFMRDLVLDFDTTTEKRIGAGWEPTIGTGYIFQPASSRRV